MTYDEWLSKYKPVENVLSDNASFDGLMFETFGSELDFVAHHPNKFVWTITSDGENTTLSNGFTFVNRIGYFVASSPYDEPTEFVEIDLTGD